VAVVSVPPTGLNGHHVAIVP